MLLNLRLFFVGLWAIAFFSPISAAATPEIDYGPVAEWVSPTPELTDVKVSDGAIIKSIYSDNQVRIGKNGEEIYSAYRVKILRPEALRFGNINISWKPTTGSVTVHSVKLIRDGVVRDILSTAKFKVIQREQNLEHSILLGNATALLQVPGIAVDDELEFAVTIKNLDPTIGDRPFGIGFLPTRDTSGAHRIRVVWDKKIDLKWQVSPDLEKPNIITSGRSKELSIQITNPKTALVPEGAPGRFKIRRLLEYSAFSSWAEISMRFWRLYQDASELEDDSPLIAKAASIASENDTSLKRADAALRLVQQKVRYVYVGLGSGNYLPATADETWDRRFGDCKGKTTLLIALLRELGIEAEAVLVNLAGSDGVDERLPNPGTFNHVVVRVRIDGIEYWLDGTGLNDPSIRYQPIPNFGWSLPLRSVGGELEKIRTPPFEYPQKIEVVELDASAGIEAPVRFNTQQIFRGARANEIRNQLVAISPDDANRALKSYWAKQFRDVEPENVEWSFNSDHAALVLKMQGTGKLDWEGNGYSGYEWYMYGAGFVPPSPKKRPSEQDQSAPWLVDFPKYSCWVTSIRLPENSTGWKWNFVSAPVDQILGGEHYWRRAAMRDNVVQSIMSRRTIAAEISRKQAGIIKEALPDFNNRKSYVYQKRVSSAQGGEEKNPLLAIGEIDWVTKSAHCNSSNWQSD